MQRKQQRWIPISAAMLATIFAATACSGGGQQPTKGAAEPGGQANEAPTEISIFLNQQTPEVMPPNNVVVKEIEKRTHTKLNLLWTPQNTVGEKMKITLSSGDIPDLMLIGSAGDPLYVQMAQQGAFWDLTPYIKEHKNMKAIPEEVWNNIKTKGKIYGLPRVRPMEGGGNMPMVRKDWLDKLGMKVPETMDDMYQVLKAFTEKDPDGNGKPDTVGLTGNLDPEGMGSLVWIEQVFNHTVGGGNFLWKQQDGKLLHTATEKGTRDALVWLTKAYKEGLLAPDFAIMKNTQARDMLMGGKAGVIGSAMNPQWLFTEAIRKIDPKGDMLPLTHLVTPDGKKWATKDSGNLGMFVIPKKVPEAKMKKILAFMDYGYSEEGHDLAIHGLKDVHYTEKDGLKVATEQAKADMVGQNTLGQMYGKYEKYQRAYLAGIPKDMYDRNVKIIDERAKIGISDPAINLLSDTYSKMGPDFNKKIQDMKTKVIMGKEPIEQWDAFTAGLKADANFQKIVTEVNEAYKSK